MLELVLFLLAIVGAVALLQNVLQIAVMTQDYHFLPETDGLLDSILAMSGWVVLFYVTVGFVSGRFVFMIVLVFKPDQFPNREDINVDAMDVDDE
ncbi:hypothetical protein K435DRAFT_853621 [Dendrothele bispora CBS 962.96]|uniref:Uncharacterized protein n=1 Tax=Dendrothele bispora (strain CBS 962.96) TaxID=1314807 RepID=A0A4S8MG20_DENBC|nr:hypothetical protein K435DRAFT_853621 [Dendrothele bispora CBS 962.96]